MQIPKVSFGAGEIEDTYWGRFEYRLHQTGLAKCRNFVSTDAGSLTRRPPTECIADVPPDYQTSRLFTLKVRRNDSFVIEMGNEVARFFRNGALLLSAPGGPAYEIAHPYLASELQDIRKVTSGDTVFFTHPTRGMWEFRRLGNINWQTLAFEFTTVPFQDENIDKTKQIQAATRTGSGVTLTATGFTFSAAQVGTRIKFRDGDQRVVPAWQTQEVVLLNALRSYNGRIYKAVVGGDNGTSPPAHEEGQWTAKAGGAVWEFVRLNFGVAIITAVAPGGATATADILIQLPEEFSAEFVAQYGATGSHRWAEQAFSSIYGWPDQIGIHKQRLYLGQGNRVWASVQSDYKDFTLGATPEKAISELLGSSSGEANDILWFSSGKILLVGTSGEEYSWAGATRTEGISQINLDIDPATSEGSAAVEPIRAKSAVLHVSADGRRLQEITYDFSIDDFVSRERSLPSAHLTAPGMAEMVFQKSPRKIVWIRRTDNQLVGFTFNPEQEVWGWHYHPMPNATVLSLAVVPGVYGDDLYLKVERCIGGRNKQFIERLLPFFDRARDTDPTVRPYVDCQRRVTSTRAISQINGLMDFAGETVTVVSNVGFEGKYLVDPLGCIELEDNDRRRRVVVGLPMLSQIRLLPGQIPSQDGSTEGRWRLVDGLKFRGLGGPGAFAGDIDKPDFAEKVFDESAQPDADQVPLFYISKDVDISGEWGVDDMVDLWTDSPYPFEILAADRTEHIGDS